MDKTKFVNLAVTLETRDKLRELAKARQTNLYHLMEMLAEEGLQKFLPQIVINDNMATEEGHL